MAKVWNKQMFQHISEAADKASYDLAVERGACPDAADYGIMERFSNKTAIAPTASISIICGGASPGIEPIAGNSYNHKTLSGSFNVRNQSLEKLLTEKGQNTERVWTSITVNEGSVQHLEFLDEHEKAVFKTAFELDQRWVIDLAADRTPFISQAQSVNVFLPADIHKRDLHQIHFSAWKKGMKSLYYCRSKSIQRAEVVTEAGKTGLSTVVKVEAELPGLYNNPIPSPDAISIVAAAEMAKVSGSDEDKYEECLSCQ